VEVDVTVDVGVLELVGVGVDIPGILRVSGELEA
jgi:hypothetical protein